jgi:selenium metabolism protein YedF
MEKPSTIILVTRNGMGQADYKLSHKLINSYFDLLIANDKLPERICFYAEGVRLCTEGSPILDVLKELEEKGVKLSICGTCLNFFGLTKKVKVGQVGDMLGLIESQWNSDKVITI